METAISIGNAKETALYFDHVVSLVFALDLLMDDDESTLTKSEYESQMETELAFMKILEPDSIRNSTEFREQSLVAQENWLNFLIEISGHSDFRGITGESELKPYFAALNSLVARQHRLLRTLALDSAPVIIPMMPHRTGALVVDEGRARDIAITISGADVVDVSQTSWEHLMEFRENRADIRKVRSLRLFAGENYAGKSMSYIEDDLGRKVDEHRQAVRAAGLPTNTGTFTVTLTSKAIATGLWGTLLSVVFDTSAYGAMAAVKGATIEIGDLKLVISRKRFALRGTLIDNPVSYATARRVISRR